MNVYIQNQIIAMIAATRNFEKIIESAARKDDGRIDKNEEKQLKKIQKTCKRFIDELNKIY